MSDATPILGFHHVHEPGTAGWTLLLLHGTGGDEHDLLELGRRLAPGAALLAPRGKVLEGSMPRFFRRLAVGQLDLPDLHVRTGELAEFIAAAAQAYALDPTRIVGLGLSNGANIAASLLLSRPGVLRAAALLRPLLPYEPQRAPALAGTSVLIDAGAADPYSPADQVERLASLLAAYGAQVELHVEPGAGHALTRNDLAVTAGWVGGLAV